jgi:hypothetical protein
VRLKLGVHFPAARGNESSGAFPAPDSFTPVSFFFEKVDSCSQDVHLALDPEPPLEAFDPALILFLDHQRFAHMNLRIYRKVYHSPQSAPNEKRRESPFENSDGGTHGVFQPGLVIDAPEEQTEALTSAGYAERMESPYETAAFESGSQAVRPVLRPRKVQ